MAGSNIKIEAETAEALAVFAELEHRAGNLRGLFADVGEYLQLSHRYRWDLAIAPDGTPWEPLDPAYQKRKKRRRDDILVLDGFLRDQLADTRKAGGVLEATTADLIFGTNRRYAAAHQFGTDDIPARPFLGLSDDDRTKILELAKEHLAEAAR